MEGGVTYRRNMITPTPVQSNEDDEADPETDADGKNQYRFVIPEDRKLGYFSTLLLIVNRMIGTGIFSTPSTIIQATDSVGATLLFWVLGGIMSFCGLMAYLELGTAIPRSGGEKLYLERIYRQPKYLATCIFAVIFVVFAHSTANSINFTTHILRAVKGVPETPKVNCGFAPTGGLSEHPPFEDQWLNKSLSIITISVVCLVHALTPKLGIWISNGLGVLKLAILTLIVFAGFAAFAGKMVAPRPDNFSSFNGNGTACDLPPYPVSTQAANYALALLQVLYSYGGWESANYVLTEVRNAPQTLKSAAPSAVFVVIFLSIFTNIAYFAASTKSQIANSGVTVAAGFFENVWGRSIFVTKMLPVLIALSALGNVSAQTFAFARVKQEIAKEGILPYSNFWASDWPRRAPSGGLFLHWIVTVLFIVGPPTSDAYPFVTNLSTYAQNWYKIFIGIGLLYLTYNKAEDWVSERTTLHAYPPATIFWIISLAFVLVAPFIKNTIVTPTIPYWVMPTLGCSALIGGILYWFLWARVWPFFGYAIQHKIERLPDGSELVKTSIRTVDSTDGRNQNSEYEHLELSDDSSVEE